jgi:hypothetical protein
LNVIVSAPPVIRWRFFVAHHQQSPSPRDRVTIFTALPANVASMLWRTRDEERIYKLYFD